MTCIISELGHKAAMEEGETWWGSLCEVSGQPVAAELKILVLPNR